MFGPYRLGDLLGQGGMGEVHRAYDTRRERTVALKRLRSGLESDTEYQKRFRRESSLAARLSSPHVIPIHDFGEIDGRLFIDMRLADGVDLEEADRHVRTATAGASGGDHPPGCRCPGLRTRGRPDPPRRQTLQRAHRHPPQPGLRLPRRLRHRPRRLDPPVLVDRHRVGHRHPGLRRRPKAFFLGACIDRRVDVYALGCLLFEALTGNPPFVGEGAVLMYHHLNKPPPRPSHTRPDIGQKPRATSSAAPRPRKPRRPIPTPRARRNREAAPASPLTSQSQPRPTPTPALGSTVSVIDTASNAVTATIPVGTRPPISCGRFPGRS